MSKHIVERCVELGYQIIDDFLRVTEATLIISGIVTIILHFLKDDEHPTNKNDFINYKLIISFACELIKKANTND